MVERYSHNMNVLLSPRHMDALKQLSDELHCSMAHVIRQAIDKAHAMVILHSPYCANGSRCLVAHLHPAPDQADTGPPRVPA